MCRKKFYVCYCGRRIAGASAIDRIREHDTSAKESFFITKKPYLPYHRPPLSKGLWTGKKKVEDSRRS